MATFRAPIAVVFSALLLTACFDGGSSSGGSSGSERPMDSSFTAFVKGLFGDTSQTAEPVSVNDREFTFNDQDNEDAFDDLIQ